MCELEVWFPGIFSSNTIWNRRTHVNHVSMMVFQRWPDISCPSGVLGLISVSSGLALYQNHSSECTSVMKSGIMAAYSSLPRMPAKKVTSYFTEASLIAARTLPDYHSL